MKNRIQSTINQSSVITRTAGDGAEDTNPTEAAVTERTGEDSQEFAGLRCSSLQTELIQDQTKRKRRQPSAGYPGLAFDSPMFSGTIMKFSLISNELKNIRNVWLKRVCIQSDPNLNNFKLKFGQTFTLLFETDPTHSHPHWSSGDTTDQWYHLTHKWSNHLPNVKLLMH